MICFELPVLASEKHEISSFTTQAFTDADIATAHIFRPKKAITASEVIFHYTSKTGTAPTLRASLQSVGDDGYPSGTILGATANALKTFNAGSLGWSNGTAQKLTLDESASLSPGNVYALMLDYSSGTIDGSNLVTLQTGGSTGGGFLIDGEYTATRNAAGAWSKSTSQIPNFAVGDGTYYHGWMVQSRATRSVNTGSSPDEVALKFTVPDMGTTLDLQYIRLYCTLSSSASKTVELKLYDGTTAIGTASIPTRQFKNPASAAWHQFMFATAPTLTCGSTYRVAIGSGDTTNITAHYYTFGSTDAAKTAMLDSCLSHRVDAGAWTDEAQQIPVVASLGFSAITYPAGTTSYHFSRARGATFGKGRW